MNTTITIDKDITKEFTKYMLKSEKYYDPIAQLISEHIKKKQEASILIDIGSGPGILLTKIKKNLSTLRIVGIDPSIEMLQIARKRIIEENEKGIDNLLSTAEKLPIKNNTVDIIVSRFSLTYWTNPQDCFQEIRRVLKPTGTIILEVLNRDLPKWKLSLIKYHMILRSAKVSIIHYHIDAYQKAYTFQQITDFLIKANFSIIRSYGEKKDWRFIIIAEKNKKI